MNENIWASIWEAIKSIGSFLLELIIAAFWGLYMIVSNAYTKLCEFIVGLDIPILPSRSRLLQENLISGTLLALLLLFIIVMNISAFNMFRKDKQKAKESPKKTNKKEDKHRRSNERISERRLLSRCFWGGAIGGFLGMKICRHKTLKKKFNIGVTLMMLIQLLLYSFLLGFFGFWIYLS